MSKLIVPITNDPITGNPREAQLWRLTFTDDFEIEIVMDIFEKDAVSGDRLFDIAQSKQGLTDLQRQDALSKHFPKRTRAYTTVGSMVNEFGQVIENGTINEIDFLTALSFAQFKGLLGKSDSDSVLNSIRDFVALKMQEISNRGQN
jgi:hypothetical protein